MKLMTQEILNRIPGLYEQDDLGDEAVVHVKFFDPQGGWKWYATEFDPASGTFFGYVAGDYPELGYFTLGELQSYRGRFGLAIERDMHFNPTPLKVIKEGVKNESRK